MLFHIYLYNENIMCVHNKLKYIINKIKENKLKEIKV